MFIVSRNLKDNIKKETPDAGTRRKLGIVFTFILLQIRKWFKFVESSDTLRSQVYGQSFVGESSDVPISTKLYQRGIFCWLWAELLTTGFFKFAALPSRLVWEGWRKRFSTLYLPLALSGSVGECNFRILTPPDRTHDSPHYRTQDQAHYQPHYQPRDWPREEHQDQPHDWPNDWFYD